MSFKFGSIALRWLWLWQHRAWNALKKDHENLTESIRFHRGPSTHVVRSTFVLMRWRFSVSANGESD